MSRVGGKVFHESHNLTKMGSIPIPATNGNYLYPITMRYDFARVQSKLAYMQVMISR